jgi:hypothetical protein
MGESTPRSIGKDDASLNEGVQASLTSTTEAAQAKGQGDLGPVLSARLLNYLAYVVPVPHEGVSWLKKSAAGLSRSVWQ